MIGHHLATNCRKSYVILSFLFFSLAGAGLTSCVSQNVSHQVEIADQAQARSAPAMERNDQVLSRRIYARIEEVMALRDSNEYEAAMEILSEIKALDDEGSLNTREQFVMWQFFANLYQIQERYEDAIIAYETMLTLQNLSQQQRQQALFYIASLNYVLRDYQEAIVRFEEYNRIGTEPDANAYLRIGTAHYLLEQYAEAIPPVLRSMEILQNKNETVPKNTYDLLRALYLTVEDYDAAMKVIEESLEFYNEEEDRVLLENIRANADGIPVNASASVILLQADRSNILNGAVNSADVEMLPIVKIIPEYPGRARIRGIEGWVLVNFIVTETGYVIEPEVIDAEPEYIFNRSALDAIEKFKFNPKQVDGAPVAVADVRYLFTYELDD